MTEKVKEKTGEGLKTVKGRRFSSAELIMKDAQCVKTKYKLHYNEKKKLKSVQEKCETMGDELEKHQVSKADSHGDVRTFATDSDKRRIVFSVLTVTLTILFMVQNICFNEQQLASNLPKYQLNYKAVNH